MSGLNGQFNERLQTLERMMEGGSGLPSYSSSDIGKVLTVGEATEYVVPEVTITGADFEPETNVYKYPGKLFAGKTYTFAMSSNGQSITETATAVEINGAVYVPYEAFNVGYMPSMFGENIVFISESAPPSSASITLSLAVGDPVASWMSPNNPKIETIYSNDGVEVAFATYHGNGMVTISSYGSGTILSKLNTAQLPKPDISYADGLGVTRLISVVFSTDASTVKGYLYIDGQGLTHYSGTSATNVYFTPITYKVKETTL